MVAATSGKLKLTVIEAQLTRDTEFFGKMDPFCRITYRNQVLKTRIKQDAGKHPVWNEAFEIEIQYVGDDIHFAVMDKDTFESEPIAYTVMKPSSFNVPGGITEWFDLQYRGKQAGKLCLRGEFHGAGGMPQQQMMQPPMQQQQMFNQSMQQQPMYQQQPNYQQQQPMMNQSMPPQQQQMYQQPPMQQQQYQQQQYQQQPMQQQQYQQPPQQQMYQQPPQQQQMYQQPPQQQMYQPQQPMMQQQPVYTPQQPQQQVVYSAQVNVQRAPMPHVYAACYCCGGTRWNPAKGRACKACVCKKCGGTGWNQKKNKPCKKMVVKMGKDEKKKKKKKGGSFSWSWSS